MYAFHIFTILGLVTPCSTGFTLTNTWSRTQPKRMGTSTSTSMTTPSSLYNTSPSSSSSSPTEEHKNHVDQTEEEQLSETILQRNGLTTSKLSFRNALPEERGKGGIFAKENIHTLEILARIPRSLIISTCDIPSKGLEASLSCQQISWSAELTAATLVSLFPDSHIESNASTVKAKQSWITSWKDGGWATHSSDLGPPDVEWGAKCLTGSLLSTGSDNDKEVYAKFRFPTHPAVYRAGKGLAMLCQTEEEPALKVLLLRSKTYRSMRDGLFPLVESPSERQGSLRERKSWDVADILSKVLSRATVLTLDGEDSYAIVPIHERLSHCDARGENSKLITSTDGKEVLLVATRDIPEGEAITRDYNQAPRIDGDRSNGSLRLLLQFGLPPNAWWF
jgi:hypothetical protein